MSETVMTALTSEEQAEIGHKLAGLVERIKGVKADAKSKAFAYREEIERLQDEQEKLAATMQLGLEPRAQLDLFVDQAEAQRALHDVAKHTCTCEGGPESDVKAPACPVHGVDAPKEPVVDEVAADEQLAEDVAATAEELRESVGEAVDVGTVEEPKTVAQFRRRKRA